MAKITDEHEGAFERAAGILPINPDIDAPPEAWVRGARDDYESLYRHYRAKAEIFYAQLTAKDQEIARLREVVEAAREACKTYWAENDVDLPNKMDELCILANRALAQEG